MPQKPIVYHFGPFTLDVAKRQLLRAQDPVKLYPKEFDTLLALAERSGQVVEKDELLRRVWLDAAVEEGNLTTHVSHLRRVLGGAPEHRDYIVTVPGRGYQFVAAVTETSDATASVYARPGRRPLRLAVAGFIFVTVVAVTFLATRTGGDPPSFQQLTYRRGAIWSARFAPDGQTIVYGAAWDGAPIMLFSTRAGSPESRALGHGADLLSISPSGELAVSVGRRFLRRWESTGILARVPLEGGAPRELLRGVKGADWSADGTELAIVRRIGSTDVLEYPVGTLLYDVQGYIMSPRVSRAGNAVAFLQRRSGDESVELVQQRGERRTLAAGLAGVTGLAWSASGTEVLFTLTEAGSTALHAVTPTGTRRLVMHAAGEWTLNDVAPDGRALMTQHHVRGHTMASPAGMGAERDLSWLDRSAAVALSDDGQLVLLAEVGAGGGANRAIYLRKLDGSPPVRLGDGDPAALSPDGKWVVANRGSAPERLVLLPTGAGNPKPLPNGSIMDYYRVKWLPDNRHLVFGAIEPGRDHRVYIQDTDGGDPVPLELKGAVGRAVFLPDGKTYVGRGEAGTHQIFGTDGRDARPVPNLSGQDFVIQASPDGASIFVVSVEGTTIRLDRLDLTTGRRVRLKEVVIRDPAGVMGIGPEFPPFLITPDGGTYVYSYLRMLSALYLLDRLE